MGVEALQIYNGCDPLDTDTCDNIISKLDTYIRGEVNETFECYKYNTRVQQTDETVDSYLNALKILAKTCNFCECMKESLLRDHIVLGVLTEHISQRLFQVRKLGLKKCLDICRSFESAINQMKVISGNRGRPLEGLDDTLHPRLGLPTTHGI